MIATGNKLSVNARVIHGLTVFIDDRGTKTGTIWWFSADLLVDTVVLV